MFEAKIAPAGAGRRGRTRTAASRRRPRRSPRRRARPRRRRRIGGGADPAERLVALARLEAALCDGPLEVARDPVATRLRPSEVRLVEDDAAPLAAKTWAMPWPISPAPPTNTLSIAIGSSLAARDHGRSRRRGSPRSRPRGLAISSSAAENGSRRCSATAASSSRVPLHRLGEQRARSRSPTIAQTCASARASRAASARSVVRGRAATVEGGQQLRDAVAGRRRSRAAPPGAWGEDAAATTRSAVAAAGAATSIARSWAAVRCAPGRSPLFTTTMSATSSSPALIAWTSSPISGASRTTVVSAAAATSTSLWPVPTVSTSTRSNPTASSTAAAAPRGRREPAGVAARGHRPDEDVGVLGVGLHPDPVTEQRAAGDRRRRVDRDDGHGRDAARSLADQGGDERRLAGARRPGDPDRVGAAGPRIELPHRSLRDRRPVLDRGQEPGERPPIAADRRLASSVARADGRVASPTRPWSRDAAFARRKSRPRRSSSRARTRGRHPHRERPRCRRRG